MIDFLEKLSIKTKILSAILILVLASMLYGWYTKVEPSTNTFTPTPQAPVVSKVPTEDVPVGKVKVYKKKEVIDKLPTLPEDIKTDPAKQVVSVVDTPKTKAGYTVVTTIDTTKGTFDTYSKEKELSLLGFENEVRIGGSYGMSSVGSTVERAYGEYTFARVGKIYTSVRGEANMEQGPNSSPFELKGLVNIEYRP